MSDDVSSRLRLVMAAASEPVTLSEAKLFLRIEHTADDTVIARAISTAREAAEQYLNCAMLPQAWEYSVGCTGKRRIMLPFGPATAIDTVSVTNMAGASMAVAPGNYRLGVDGFALFLDPPPVGDFLTITYHASLADTAAALPSLLKQGMLHHVAALAEMRDGTAPMPLASLQCYQPFRRIHL